MTHRITRNLSKYMEQNEINIMRIALREMIINAIEHGNLEISYEDKSRALIEDRYFLLVSERQHDARYANRKIIIYPESLCRGP